MNPEKIDAIVQMKPPTCVRNVQRLAGCVAAISRFMSRLGEKVLPLYKLLKKGDKFFWNDEAFEDLKMMISSAPILASPLPREPMMMYIAATNRVVSVVMIVECTKKGKA